MKTVTCETCLQPFVREAECSLGPQFLQTDCDLCLEQDRLKRDQLVADRKREEATRQAMEAFREICPSRFFESNPEHPEFRKPLLEKAKEWEPTDERPWLGIVGKKGSCKTRIAIMRTRQQIRGDRPRWPFFVAAHDFAEAVQFRFNDETGKSRQLIQACRNSTWLILDDIGKARATPGVVAALFALLDHRHSHNLVTIWTSNSTPEEFCDGMPADTAGPMVRRLKETSTLLSVA